MLERPLRALAVLAATMVAVGFIVFAVAQGHEASATQQHKINGHTVVTKAQEHRSGLHRTIDDIDHAMRAPFAFVVDGSDSEWARHGVGSLLALLFYGAGLGTLARFAHARPYRGR